MRTTLTLDPDVAILLDRLRREKEKTMKELINEGLRVGLRTLESPEPRRESFTTRTVSLGRCLLGDLSDVSEALELAERDEGR